MRGARMWGAWGESHGHTVTSRFRRFISNQINPSVVDSEGPLEARSPQTLNFLKTRFFEVKICVLVQDTKADACKLAL